MSYCIYKIVCDDLPDYVYVGSTKAFRQRKAHHKSSVNKDNSLLYKTIRENGGWNNWRMVCIEECDETIDSKRKVEAREEQYRQELKSNLNMNRCYLTEEQLKEQKKEIAKKYYEKNKDKFKEEYKKYYETNKEKLKEYKKEWYETNKEKINKKNKKYNETNKEKLKEYKKEYYEKNKDKIKEGQKKYREANKDKIKE